MPPSTAIRSVAIKPRLKSRENHSIDRESVSIVIPFYNEAGNVSALIDELCVALQDVSRQWEIIAVDDGSYDATASELHECRQRYGEFIQIIQFARNFGQTAAMQAGIEAANGDLIVTMDGDRQNDPTDIPAMINYLLQNDLDLVCGWRQQRKDKELQRKFPSRLANWLIRRTTGVTIQDYGCSLKVYRASIIKQVHLIGEMHRFIPAWVACVTDASRIDELPVNHRARLVGHSKYGLSRTTRVLLDLLAVLFFMRFSRRPGHFFGSIGLGCGFGGTSILTYLLMLKIFFNADIGGRPLLFTGILLVIAGIQFITTGVLAEMQTRTSTTPSYSIRFNSTTETRLWNESIKPSVQ